MNTQRVIFKWLAVVILSVMVIQSAIILPSASAQAANTPTMEHENQTTDCNAGPCPVTSPPSTSHQSLQSFTATGSVTGITDPTLIPNASVYDFSEDAPVEKTGI
jgi:hypothetical protein